VKASDPDAGVYVMVEKTRTTSILLSIFYSVPLVIRKWFFRSLFFLLYHLDTKHRLIVLHNLFRAFPEKKFKEVHSIAAGSYRHLAIVAAEFFDLPFITRENIHEWVDVEGLDNFNAAIAQGQGVLSIVAHFGNGELMTIAVPMFAKPMQIVYRPLDNPVFDNLVEYVRTLHGNVMIPKGGSGKLIMELLMENQIIGILSDQNVSVHEGMFVDFFGRPACSSVGLAVMALRSGSPVIPAFMARQKSGKYKLIIKPAVKIIRTGTYETDLLENTQHFTKIVEEVIRTYPDQWFWLHQRWKSKKCQIRMG
jgi:Kdo2-lipid IVA lauroyltransferase/acyltransferase